MKTKKKILAALAAVCAIAVIATAIGFATGNTEDAYAQSGEMTAAPEQTEAILAAEAAAGNAVEANTLIGESVARAIALEHAALTEADVTYLRAKLEYEDGRRVYDIDFYSGRTEYDYEIDAYTGTIVSFDHDVENYAIPTTTQKANADKTTTASKTTAAKKTTTASNAGSSVIGESAAKSAALAHAGLKASDVSYTKCKLEYDDGRRIYDIEFYSGGTEYDFEIDAYTGKIVSYDYESKNGAAAPAASGGGSYISLDEAKAIALQRANRSASQVTFTETSFEYDDGVAEYQIEFISGDMEYEVEVRATDGRILDYEAESKYD